MTHHATPFSSTASRVWKTEIYMRALAKSIAQAKQGIVLRPRDFADTANDSTLRCAVQARRGCSSTTQHRRAVRYMAALPLGGDVVIGARSALFARSPNLVDRDGRRARFVYKHRSAHYHAREVALNSRGPSCATVIFATRPPDVETTIARRAASSSCWNCPRR